MLNTPMPLHFSLIRPACLHVGMGQGIDHGLVGVCRSVTVVIELTGKESRDICPQAARKLTLLCKGISKAGREKLCHDAG